MEKQYLYGAAVQGIQSYIFKTNKLKEIAESSDLIASICSTTFQDFLGDSFQEDKLVIGAAGNIKYIFDNMEECQKTVSGFPKVIATLAPDITLSQAVVEINPKENAGDKISELEKKLREQRNKRMRSITLGISGIKRDKRTGLPIVLNDRKSFDKNSQSLFITLCSKMFGNNSNVSSVIEEWEGVNKWIAVIHADGNGLGKIVRDFQGNPDKFAAFSKALSAATENAAKLAYEDVKAKIQASIIPMRPVVLGGDDLTIICRGDLAIPFVTAFIKHFEDNTGKVSDIPGALTACAGVAFIKSSYPFSYGYSLAEELCREAKKDSRDRSSIMFHRVRDSFLEDYKTIVKRTLMVKDSSYGISSLNYGPYVIEPIEGRWSISHLEEKAEFLNLKFQDRKSNGSTVKNGLRKWLTHICSKEMEKNSRQILTRLKNITDFEDYINEVTEPDSRKAIPAYDILAYNTILSQVTNINKEDNNE